MEVIATTGSVFFASIPPSWGETAEECRKPWIVPGVRLPRRWLLVAFSQGWGEALGCLQAGPGPALHAPGARRPSLPCVAELTQHPDRLKVLLQGGGQGRGLFLPHEGPGSRGDPMPEAAAGPSRPDLWAPSRLFQVVSLGLTCPMALAAPVADCCFLCLLGNSLWGFPASWCQ